MATRKYVSLHKLSLFFDKLKTIFASKTDLNDTMEQFDEKINEKADAEHIHNDIYYTKAEIDNIELITVDDIDNICASSVK